MSQVQTNTTRATVPASIRSALVLESTSHRLAAIPLFIALTVLGSYLAFPLPGTPVPVTLQTIFVLLSGVLLGPWLGASAMAGYLALGVAGFPVFAAGGAGLAWLVGPTGGYLVAFPAAAFVAGWMVGSRHTTLRLVTAFATGTFIVLLGGVSQLAFLTNSSLVAAAMLGAIPFLPGALVKVGIGVAVVRFTARGRPSDM